MFIKLLANLLHIVTGNLFEQYDLQGDNEVQLCQFSELWNYIEGYSK